MKKIPIPRKPNPLPIPDTAVEVIIEFIRYIEEKEKTKRVIEEVKRDIREIEFKEKVVNLFFENTINKKLYIKEKTVERLLDVIAEQSKKGKIQKDLLDTLTSLVKDSVITDEENKFLENIISKENKAILAEFEEED